MMPLGLERTFNTIIVSSAVFHVAAGSALSRLYGHTGMAVTVAATELLIPSAIYLALRARRLDPLFPQSGVAGLACALVSERAI